jgi:hypothetical protein
MSSTPATVDGLDRLARHAERAPELHVTGMGWWQLDKVRVGDHREVDHSGLVEKSVRSNNGYVSIGQELGGSIGMTRATPPAANEQS